MADAVVSVVAERILGLLEEQARYHINLVRGAEEEVVSLAKELKMVRNELDDAERRGYKEESIKDWLVRLEQTSYEMEDVLDEWNYAILKLQIENHGPEDDVAAAASKKKVWSCIPSSSCLCFKKVVVRHHIAKKILDVKAQLDDILRDKKRYTFVLSQPPSDLSLPGSWRVQSNSSVELEKVYGRDFDRDNIVSKLMVSGDSNIVSVVGVGGLGKTTVAQLVYNDSRVKECFELRIWICVSDPFDEVAIAKRIVESVKGSSPNTDQLELALKSLRKELSGKKFLLVLDDVWNVDHSKWEPLRINLKCGGEGIKILVTTRNEKAARMMGTIENDIYRPRELSLKECWSLLSRIAHFGRRQEDCEKFQEVGKRIASKCKGLPLAATVLGSLLQFKYSLEEWENVFASEIWRLEEAQVQLFPHLLLTYNELSPAVKRCFSYCALFPKDSFIRIDELIEHWIAQGYLGSDAGNVGDLELKGQECYKILVMRSLLQDLDKGKNILTYLRNRSCKMHDIVHDFAQFLRKDRSSVRSEARMVTPTCRRCSSISIPSVKTCRSLLLQCSNLSNICDCLTSLRVFSMMEVHMEMIPQEIVRLIHLRRLDLFMSLSSENVKAICKLYNLQFLVLSSCRLDEVPEEIGNLINLRYLYLSYNDDLKELPESICGLHELRSIDIGSCRNLSGLPEGISKLTKLKHIHNIASGISHYPQGLAQLVSLSALSQFAIGKGSGKLGLLKNLNHLSGFLLLIVVLGDDTNDVVEDVLDGDLRNKMQLQTLVLKFEDEMGEENARVRMDVVSALEPHPNLQNLRIDNYAGYKLEGWITSPLCQLRSIKLESFTRMTSLPPLGKLPRLEEIEISEMIGLKHVGREFLGITGDRAGVQSSSSSVCGFLKHGNGRDKTIHRRRNKTIAQHACGNFLSI